MIRGWRNAFILAVVATVPLGCGGRIETYYGRMRGASVNGTGALAAMFRREGHEVRAAARLTDELAGWADVIVRFAPTPGPPRLEEARWYEEWLAEGIGVGLVYIPRDYDAEPEYWDAVLKSLPEKDEAARARVQKRKGEAEGWPARLPPRAERIPPAEDWFEVDAASKSPTRCRTLAGPWAQGIDPALAALTRHQALKVGGEDVLLEGDGGALAIEWEHPYGPRILVVANGSFLLNATLVNRARRPLAARVVDWVGEEPLRIAFVEGPVVLEGDETGSPSLFSLLTVPPFGWIAAQLFALGLAACLARAPRLGRPRPEPPSGEDRPAAHPEALGDLWARTKEDDEARRTLQTYRRWRHPSRRDGPDPPPPGRSDPAGSE